MNPTTENLCKIYKLLIANEDVSEERINALTNQEKYFFVKLIDLLRSNKLIKNTQDFQKYNQLKENARQYGIEGVDNLIS